MYGVGYEKAEIVELRHVVSKSTFGFLIGLEVDRTPFDAQTLTARCLTIQRNESR